MVHSVLSVRQEPIIRVVHAKLVQINVYNAQVVQAAKIVRVDTTYQVELVKVV